MPLDYKIDVLAELKAAGYNTNRIRQEGLLSQATLQRLRSGEPLAWSSLEALCRLLRCQPGDILEYREEQKMPDKINAEKKSPPSSASVTPGTRTCAASCVPRQT